ncbi:hypothetical protein QE152_g35839 [Popillia japonica]|uniref:Uncharacterized protein n=1 Tax=Popillia japonica TaxID=7064 RepID=A0AAW1IEY3_POPJA
MPLDVVPMEDMAAEQQIIMTPQLSPQQQQQVQQQQLVAAPPPGAQPPPPAGICAYPAAIIGAPGLPAYFSADHIRHFPVPPPNGGALIHQEHVIEVIRSRPSINEQQQYEQAGSSNWVPQPSPAQPIHHHVHHHLHQQQQQPPPPPPPAAAALGAPSQSQQQDYS